MKHVLDITDLSVEEINGLIDTAIDIINNKEKYQEVCKHKKLATLFFEPSTRTRLSFEAAMLELGGSVIGFSSASSSSSSKGESVQDTVKVVGYYADIIAMRHPKEGAPMAATAVSDVPIINAGDGGHHHPTQTLADLLTIHREKGRFDNLTVGFCGDLKFGRTVHSLVNALSRYTGIKLVFISPDDTSSEVEDISGCEMVIPQKSPGCRWWSTISLRAGDVLTASSMQSIRDRTLKSRQQMTSAS